MKKCLVILCLLSPLAALSQDIQLTRAILDTLTSKTMWGRGYTNNGLDKAAEYINAKFEAYGLSPMDGKTFKQHFSFPVNTFPGKMELKINGQTLVPGKEFIVMPESVGKIARGKLIQKDSSVFVSERNRIVLILRDKLTWSVSKTVADYTGIEIIKPLIKKPETIDVNIEHQLVPDFKAVNLCGIVKGTLQPDSFIVLTAHYDHLGGMGSDTYFPGANDNASGVSFLLSMAKYYAANPAPYSMAFICFSGEEAGLVGSKHFTEQPLLELSKIRFLINLDMVGTGETGITVVNATQYPKEFELLNQVNNAHNYLVRINPRGKAANSDHFHFTEKGVPAFFIYTTGGVQAYHDVYDQPEHLPFTEYNDLFSLFLNFNKKLMK
jgi:aminopeptidase YwaD